LPSAAIMVVLARSTSTTSAVDPGNVSRSSRSGRSATSRRTALPLIPERADAQAQRVEIDESLGVALPIHGIGLEGGEVGPVEGALGPAPGHGDVALVELEADGAGHVAGAAVDQPLEGLPLGGV